MCFGGGSQSAPPVAAAPPQPEKPPLPDDIQNPRQKDEKALYGNDQTPTRVEDRTNAPASVGRGGTGLRM